MSRVYVTLGLFLSFVCLSFGARLIDPAKCPGGCKEDSDCTLNSVCSEVYDATGKSCSYCVCPEGYVKKGARCVAIKGYTTTTQSTTTRVTTTKSTPTTTAAPTTADQEEPEEPTTKPTMEDVTTVTTAAPTVPTTTGTTPQGPPPTSYDQVTCSEYDCSASPNIQSSDNDDPLVVRSGVVNTNGGNPGCKRQLVIHPRPCNLKGGGSCFGAYCLPVSSGNDYCICPYYRVDRQCAVDKPGSCSQASGQPQSGTTQLNNRRLRSKSDPDHGSVYARHFANSMGDCIKLCQWAKGLCRSVNFGKINNVKVCELMSIAATEKNLLAPWLGQESGWQYCQVSN